MKSSRQVSGIHWLDHWFDNNDVFTTSESNAMLKSGVAYPLIELFACGSGNTLLSSRGDYTFDVAGRSFRIQRGVLTEQ